MAINLKLSAKSRRLLQRRPEVIVPAVSRALRQGLLLAERRVRGTYLSGRALNRQTGRLRNSVTSDVRIRGNQVIGAIGTNVVYGRFWELGYSGPVSVKAHTRTIRQVFGRPIPAMTVDVRAHVRQVNAEARPFLRPGVEDVLPDIRRLIKKRILEAMR